MKIIKFALLTGVFIFCINIVNSVVSAKPKVSSAAARKSRSADVEKKGVVKWFNPAKGFGFIKQVDGGKDVIAMAKDIQKDGFKTLDEGQEVIFTLYEDAKGLKSRNIIPLRKLKK